MFSQFICFSLFVCLVSRATLGRLWRDGAEHVWASLSAVVPSLAETETVCLNCFGGNIRAWVGLGLVMCHALFVVVVWFVFGGRGVISGRRPR